MVFTEALRMLITADTGQAVTSIKTLGSTTDRELGKSTKTIDKWSRGFTVAGAGMVAFGAAALTGLGMAAKSASDLGEAVNASQVVFGRASGTIDKFAENSATSMGLSQRAFRQALVPIGAMLQNFGMSQEEAADQSVKLAQRAADMASVFNTDVNDALAAIQAGLRGEMDPLERFGVGLNEAAVNAKAMELGLATSTGEVDAAAKAQARLALIFEQTDKFAGDFANTSGSLANRQRILAAQFEDLKAAIGEGALPVFETFVDVASKGIGAFQGVNDATGGMVGKIATIGSVGLIAAGGLSVVIGQLIKMRESFTVARDAVASFAGSGGLGRLTRISLAIGGLIALREVLGTIDDELEDVSVAKLENELLQLGRSADVVGPQLERILGGKGPLASGEFTAGMDDFAKGSRQFKKDIDALDEALAQLTARDPKAAAAAFDRITEALERQGIPAARVKEEFDAYADAVASGKTAAETATGGVDELTGGMEEQADATTAAQDALQEYLDTLSAMFDPLFGATDALMDNREAQAGVTQAAIELAAAQKEHGASSLEAMVAEQQLAEAQRAAGKSALDVKQATAELNAAIAENPSLVGEAKDMLASWVSQGLISQDTAAELARQFDGTANAADRLGDTDPNVKVTETGGSRVRGTLDKVQQAAINAGRQRPNVRVSATDRASGILRNVQNLIFGIPRSKTFTFNAVVTGLQELNRARALTGRQHGGPVLAHEAYVVGENGPELLLMGNQSGTVLPHGVSAPGHMAAGGGGGTTINVAISGIVASDGRELERVVVKAIKSAGEHGRPITVRGRRL